MAKQLKIFTEFEKELIEFEGKYKDVVYDFSTKKNERQARSDRHAIGTVIGSLDAAHREEKAPLLERTKVLDAARKELKDRFQKVQGRIKSQIEAHEATVQKRIDDIQARITRIKGAIDTCEHANSGQIKRVLTNLENLRIDESFEEFQNDALYAKMDAVVLIQNRYDEIVEIGRAHV